MQIDKITAAMKYAAKVHEGQPYGKNLPYTYHLECVYNILYKFGYKDEEQGQMAILHDAIEDCKCSRTRTYREIKEKFGLRVAEGVYCVTDELGRTREEEKKATYPKIKSNDDAILVKIADRIANTEYSMGTNNVHMMEVYLEEYASFKNGIKTDKYSEMWEHLDMITDACSSIVKLNKQRLETNT